MCSRFFFFFFLRWSTVICWANRNFVLFVYIFLTSPEPATNAVCSKKKKYSQDLIRAFLKPACRQGTVHVEHVCSRGGSCCSHCAHQGTALRPQWHERAEFIRSWRWPAVPAAAAAAVAGITEKGREREEPSASWENHGSLPVVWPGCQSPLAASH